jgi:hypothetical protein
VKDSDFKALPHRVGEYRIASRGTKVADGYKPDITVNDPNGQLAFILECEQKTDRKAFIGDLVKAEKYAEENGARPVLVIVMKLAPNTTLSQISSHLTPYATWLRGRNGGALSLSGVLVITDDEYAQSVHANELLTSPRFRARAAVVV